MSDELIGIITAGIALAGLNLFQARAIRSDLRDVRLELREAARERAELRDRLGRIEGYLDVLREFFVGSGRGTAA